MIWSARETMQDFKEFMKSKFDATDLGNTSYVLGVEVIQKNEGIFIC